MEFYYVVLSVLCFYELLQKVTRSTTTTRTTTTTTTTFKLIERDARVENMSKDLLRQRTYDLCHTGGMVALFTGMSILTLFEFIMWLLEIPMIIR